MGLYVAGVSVFISFGMGVSMVILGSHGLLLTVRMAVTAISFVSVEVSSKMEMLGPTVENLDLNDVEE